MKRHLTIGTVLLIAVIVESISAVAFIGGQGYRSLFLTRKLSAEAAKLAQENQKLEAVLALHTQIEQDTKTLAAHQESGAQVGTDQDLVVFVEKMDALARSAGLAWSSLTYQGFAPATTASTSYPPNLKVVTLILSAKGTWAQFLAFVDTLEHYPGVVSLGEPLDLPFLGGTRPATVVSIPVNFIMSSPNDPSWMIQKAPPVVVPPTAAQGTPSNPSASTGTQ